MIHKIWNIFTWIHRENMPLYKAWDVYRKTRKAVAASLFHKFVSGGEWFHEQFKNIYT